MPSRRETIWFNRLALPHGWAVGAWWLMDECRTLLIRFWNPILLGNVHTSRAGRFGDHVRIFNGLIAVWLFWIWGQEAKG